MISSTHKAIGKIDWAVKALATFLIACLHDKHIECAGGVATLLDAAACIGKRQIGSRTIISMWTVAEWRILQMVVGAG